MSDSFELVGKRIVVVMQSDAFHDTFTFGEPVPGSAGVWIIVGKVVGDVPGIGFWLTVSTIMSPQDKQRDLADSGQVDPTYLIRWERVLSARIVPPDFKASGPVGFRPHLPE